MSKTVIVGVALDHSSSIENAMSVAQQLSEKDGHIIALHVIEQIPGYAAHQVPADILARRRPEAMEELQAELRNYEKVDKVVVFGHAGRTIVSFADEQDADCIVIASHQPGLSDYFLGSTAQSIVRHAHCSVHVQR